MAVNDRFNGVLASKAIKVPCVVATSANITLSGNQTIDGVAVVTDDRVLVRAQTNAVENGIYIAKDAAWERAADWDGNRDITRGTQILAYDSANNASIYVVETDDPIYINTTAVTIGLYSQGATVAVEAGSVTDAMLRWDGIDTYRDMSRLRATAQGAEFRWYASNLSDYAEQTYVGTAAIFSLSNAAHNFQFSNDVSIVGGDLIVTGGTVDLDQLIVGDPGTEDTGISIDGVTYESSLKVSDLGGSNLAQTILHRHSTTIAPVIVGARSNSDTSAHTLVTDGQALLWMIGSGWDGASYQRAAEIEMVVDGVAAADDMPGRIVFRTTPDGAKVPVERLRLGQGGSMYLNEIAAADGDLAGFGQVYVDSADSLPYFRDDAGGVYPLTGGGGGVMSGKWNFDSTTTQADPGSGNVRFSSGTPSAVVAMYISETSLDGDWTQILDRWGGEAMHMVVTNAARDSVHRFQVDGPVTDNGGWRRIDVLWLGGTTNAIGFTNGEELDFEFLLDPYTEIGTADFQSLSWDDNVKRFVNTSNVLISDQAPPPLDFGILTIAGAASANDVRRPHLYFNQGAIDAVNWYVERNLLGNYMRSEMNASPYVTLWGHSPDNSTQNDIFSMDSNLRFNVLGDFRLLEQAAAGADELNYGQIWVNSTDQGLYYTGEAGADVRLDVVTPTFNTPLRIIGDTDGAPPASQTALLEFYDSDESDRQAHIGYSATNDFIIQTDFANNGQDFSIFHGGDRILHNEGTGGRTYLEAGTGVTGDIYIRPNAGNDDGIRVMYQGSVELYENNALVAQTAAATSGGFVVNNQVTAAGTERVLTETDRSRGWPCTIYQFDSSTTSSDPGNGNFRLNNATASLATEMYIDDNNEYIQNSDRLIEYLSAGDIISFHRLDANNLHTWFRVTGTPTDNTGWWTVPIEYLYGTSFASTELYTLFPFHLSQTQGVLADGTVTGSALYWNGSSWVEWTDVRRTTTGRMDIFAADDLLPTEVGIQLFTNSGTLRGEIGNGFRSSAFVFYNRDPGGVVEIMGRNDGDTTIRSFLIADPEVDTQLRGQIAIDFEIGGTTRVATMVAASLNTGTLFIDNNYNGSSVTGGSTEERVWTESQQDWITASAMYRFETSTAASDPGHGDLRFDNATPASVTNIYVDDLAHHDGHDVDWLWASLSDGDMIIIRSNVDQADYWMGTVNGTPTDNTGWWTIPVTHVRSGSLFSADDLLNVSVQYLSEAAGGGGTIGGSITDNQVAVGAATANNIEGDANFTYDAATLTLDGGVDLRIRTGGELLINTDDNVTTSFRIQGATATGNDTTLTTTGDLVHTGGDLSYGDDLGIKFGASDDARLDYDSTQNRMELNMLAGVGLLIADATDTGIMTVDMSVFRLDSAAEFQMVQGTANVTADIQWNGTAQEQVYGTAVTAVRVEGGIASMPYEMRDGVIFSLWDATDSTRTEMQQDSGGLTLTTSGNQAFDFKVTDGGAVSVLIVDQTRTRSEQPLFIAEITAAAVDLAGYGQLWVNDTDGDLYYTDELGNDERITGLGASIGGSIADNQVAVGAATADTIEGSSGLTWDGSTLFVTGSISANTATAGGIVDEASSATNPTLIPRRNDTDTGIGSNAADQLSIICGGIEFVRFVESTNNSTQFQLPIYIEEQATANPDIAAYGQLWVRLATPNELWFTDDAGTDFGISIQQHLQDYSIESSSSTPTGTTQTLSYPDGPAFEVDLESVTGNITITLSNAPASGNYGQIVVKVTQDSTVARTITWAGGTFEWAGGTAHPMTTTLNGWSIFTFETWDGGTTWYGAGADYS